MIHSGTLCIQRKVTKFPCFGCLVFRAQFQHFLSAFWHSLFAMQLALVFFMMTITPTLSLNVFSLQRTRLLRTCGQLWRTPAELWFEMQRRLTLLLLLFASTKFCDFGTPTIFRVLIFAISRSQAKFCDFEQPKVKRSTSKCTYVKHATGAACTRHVMIR